MAGAPFELPECRLDHSYDDEDLDEEEKNHQFWARSSRATTATWRAPRPRRHIHVEERQLRAGIVEHGYALTGHRAQGGTWALTIAVGTDGLYREGACVALSRGRASNWLIVTAPQMRRMLWWGIQNAFECIVDAPRGGVWSTGPIQA